VRARIDTADPICTLSNIGHMSIRSGIAHVLDRPGGRTLLAALATRHARRLSQDDVEVWYDGVWHHRSGQIAFADGSRFQYIRDEFRRWSHQVEKCVAASRDYWYYAGAPLPGETVIDVGAGRGEDLLAFCESVGSTGRVIAIEAHPITFRSLRRFCDLNRLAIVLPVHAAALDHEGAARMSNCDDWQDNSIDEDGEIAVPARTLDNICRADASGPFGLVKMNIEGSEVAALRGAARLLARTRLVTVACHDFRADRGEGERFRTRVEVLRMLEAAGFAVSVRSEDPRAGIQDHVFGVRR
jgi:FkbM family methyltransferase